MNDSAPPPYSPQTAGAVVSPPLVLVNRAPTLPPSYDAAVADDVRHGNDGNTRIATSREPSPTAPLSPQSRLAQPQPPPATALSTSPTSSSFVSRLSALRSRRPSKSGPDKMTSTPVAATAAATAKAKPTPVSELTPAQVEDLLASIFRHNPWKRSWGPWPATLDAALRTAALNGNAGLARALLDAGAPIKFTDRYAAIKIKDGSVLHAALRGGAPELADEIVAAFWGRLVSSGDMNAADTRTASLVDARDGQGCAPLHVAAEAGATEAARRLLQRGAEVDAVDDFGRTPLHMAARYGRRDTAEMLVAAGADTCHLLPSPHSAEGLAPPWAEVRLLRGSAGADRLAALGDHRVVTELVSSIVAGTGGQKSDVKGDGNGKKTKQFAVDTAVDSSTQASSSSPSGAPSYRHSSSRPARTSFSRPVDSFTLPPDTSSLKPNAPAAAPVPQRLHQDPWRRPQVAPSSLTSTPAYARWREGLETLQTEHRAQRARNEREAVPDGMDM
ncbi:MAG: hypothetical protein STHCBS139747_005501 [Sporothrix thermara]